MLYTIVPEDQVWSEEDDDRQLVWTWVEGVRLLARNVGDGRGQIEQVISTDPAHYLDPRFQPGMMVNLR